MNRAITEKILSLLMVNNDIIRYLKACNLLPISVEELALLNPPGPVPLDTLIYQPETNSFLLERKSGFAENRSGGDLIFPEGKTWPFSDIRISIERGNGEWVASYKGVLRKGTFVAADDNVIIVRPDSKLSKVHNSDSTITEEAYVDNLRSVVTYKGNALLTERSSYTDDAVLIEEFHQPAGIFVERLSSIRKQEITVVTEFDAQGFPCSRIKAQLGHGSKLVTITNHYDSAQRLMKAVAWTGTSSSACIVDFQSLWMIRDAENEKISGHI